MVHLHKLYCFHCGQRYDQTSQDAPTRCGGCGSRHVGVYTEADIFVINGYDYTNQAWVRDGRYVACGHVPVPATGKYICDCYGRLHQGEQIAIDADVH